MPALTIQQIRGGSLESEHEVTAVLAQTDGTVVERVGERMVTTMRSAAKPFQLEASLSLLPVDVVDELSDRELAVGASSHSAQAQHVNMVRTLLARFGLDVSHLYCGAHWPIHEESGRQLLRDGVELSSLHNNCSGKHTFMAAASAAHGWDPDYRDPAHPLQQVIREYMERYTGGRIDNVVVDGCGVPCWVSSVAGFATSWAHVATAMAEPDSRLGRIGWAMHRDWWWMSGDGRIDAVAVAHASRPIVAKVGAQALLCLALPEEGLGIALKVRSADNDARAVALQAVLERWFPGLLPVSAVSEWATVRNVIGRPVGERIAIWE